MPELLGTIALSDKLREAAALMPTGAFVEVFVDTPLDIYEQRDTKGLYARARTGEISNLTGVDDPYERPKSPELVLNTVGVPPETNASEILEYLVIEGFVRTNRIGVDAS